MTRRIGLAPLMALIVVFAGGFGAMRAASEGVARGVFLGSVAALLLATVGAIVRTRGRDAWVGCTVFGWGYALLVLGQVMNERFLITNNSPTQPLWVNDLALEVVDRLHPYLPLMVSPFPSERLDNRERDGKFYRLVAGEHVPFDTAEQKLFAEFADQVSAQGKLAVTREHATQIGLAFQGIAFALIGAIAGQFLARPPKNAVASNPRPTDQPG